MDAEKASIQSMQTLHTYTILSGTCNTMLGRGVAKCTETTPHNTDVQSPHNLSCSFHTDSKFHTVRAATIQFLVPQQQDWRQDRDSTHELS